MNLFLTNKVFLQFLDKKETISRDK